MFVEIVETILSKSRPRIRAAFARYIRQGAQSDGNVRAAIAAVFNEALQDDRTSMPVDLCILLSLPERTSYEKGSTFLLSIEAKSNRAFAKPFTVIKGPRRH